MLVRIMTRGKVNVIAATWTVPSCPMNAISSIETRMLLETPTIMGAVSRNSDRGTESRVRSRDFIAGIAKG
jgi:hypothetical protein